MDWVSEVLSFLFKTLSYRFAIRRLKKKGLLVYLKSLQVVRKSLATAILVFFILQVMVISFLGVIVTGIWLLPEDNGTKLWILFAVFGSFFLIPMVILSILFSQRLWLHMSGVEHLLKGSTPPS